MFKRCHSHILSCRLKHKNEINTNNYYLNSDVHNWTTKEIGLIKKLPNRLKNYPVFFPMASTQ